MIKQIVNKFLNRPIKFKLIFMGMIIASTALLPVGVAFIRYDITSVRNAAINELSLLGQIIGKISAPVIEFPGNPYGERVTEYLTNFQTKSYVVLVCMYKKDGSIVAEYKPRKDIPSCSKEVPIIGNYFIDKYLIIHQVITAKDGKDVGSIYIKADQHDMEKDLRDSFVHILISMSALLFIAFIVTHKGQKIVSTPIQTLANTMQSIIDNGDYSARAKKFYDDELGGLVNIFNRLLSLIQQRDYEVTEVNEKLKGANEHLEDQVKIRTLDLEKALKAKSNFLSNMSHEIRTPNNVTLNCSGFVVDDLQFIKDRLEKAESLADPSLVKELLDIVTSTLVDAKKINAASKGQSLLLNDILDLSKMGEDRMEYDMRNDNLSNIVAPIAHQITGLYEGKKDLTVTFVSKISDDDCMLVCDRTRIGQVVLNLLGNAIKYSDDGAINVTIDAATIVLPYNKVVPALQFSVSDEGIGIPPDELKAVFEKFTESSNTKKQSGGTGLGLAICDEIVRAHHGMIWAENRPEKGSIFHFTLPKEQPEAATDNTNGA